jgi:hypothetical protein
MIKIGSRKHFRCMVRTQKAVGGFHEELVKAARDIADQWYRHVV